MSCFEVTWRLVEDRPTVRRHLSFQDLDDAERFASMLRRRPSVITESVWVALCKFGQ